MHRSLFVASVLVMMVWARPLAAPSDPDWSRFRGPNGTGVSATAGLPTDFGPDKHVLWKTALPTGHSSPVLTRTRIFLTAHDSDALLVLALDRATGREAWRRSIPQGAERTARRAQRSRVTVARDRRGSRLCVLPGLRPGRVQRRGQGAVAPAARTVQHVLRLRRVTDPGGRDSDPACRSGQRFVPARRGREVRQAPLQSRSSRRDLRLLDADGLSAEGRSEAGAHSRVVPVVGLRRRRTGTACGGSAGWRAR